ncbi:MAG: hypothetical protein OEQ47_04700 [Acidimicrobiia bacterium]|nr:hypothetical protein [Acidimicrobiia bacterium]
MRVATRLKVMASPRWQKTEKEGNYSLDHEDGTRSYIATWDEHQPISITDRLTTKCGWIERHAETFEEACRLQAQGEEAERKRQRKHPQSRPQRLGERLMAAKWFEYWAGR